MLSSREAFAQIKREYGGSGQMHAFVALMDILLNETRERQDDAIADDLLKNQGAIKILKTIRKNLLATGEKYPYTESYQS